MQVAVAQIPLLTQQQVAEEALQIDRTEQFSHTKGDNAGETPALLEWVRRKNIWPYRGICVFLHFLFGNKYNTI